MASHVGPDDADPLNLYRIHWFNDAARTGRVPVPDHVVLPKELTGVDARSWSPLGDRFPMIRAHKVLAAYACLVPRIVTGAFDPVSQRAGLALDRQLLPRRRGDLPHPGCHGVAALPRG